MRDRKNQLFAKGELYRVLEQQKKEAVKAIAEISSEQIHASSDDQLIEHFLDRFSITPLTLYPERAEKAMNE